MPKCMMLRNGITISPRGKVRPCCVYNNKKIDYSITDNELWQPYFEEQYLQMESSNDWIPECNECQLEEESLGRSLRTRSLELYENTQPTGIKYWDLKISNTCNLWCRMCSGGDSSTWVQKVAANKNLDWDEHLLWHDEVKLSWHDTDLPLVKEKIIDANVIKFTGGEPMLVKHVKEVIQYLIDTEFSYGIELLFTTNATVPWEGWWETIIPKFKNVIVTMSIDGIGERFEYQRAGAKWAEVEKNAINLNHLMKKYDNLLVNINYTNTAINAACKADTAAWAKRNNIFFNKGGVEILHPEYLSYKSLPNHLRERYGVTGNFDFDPKQLEILKKQMAIQDKVAGTDFKTVCPEFFEGEDND